MKFGSVKNYLRKLGPGVITGASDDDPSGIATYSMAGAQTGYSLLWSALLTLPLMAAIQEMAARIGLVTGKGLAGNMRTHYPKVAFYLVVALVFLSNTLNVGADLAGMAQATTLILPGPSIIYVFLYSALTVFLLTYLSYNLMAKVLRWLAFALFAYVAAAFLAGTDWAAALKSTILPQISYDKTYIALFVAILGTTISPYLFFWQASEEVEELEEKERESGLTRAQIVTPTKLKEMRTDVITGMSFSNLVMYFIIATTAATLHRNGIFEITSAADAAQALEPLAGNAASLLFTLGVVGTGLLAIPVLAGAAAYAMAEAFGWREGLNKQFHRAKAFYLVIALSVGLGTLMNAAGVDPFQALFFTALIYGLISPILIYLMIHLANNKRLMHEHTNGLKSNLLSGLTLVIMTVAALLFFVTL